jgi:hypothetical protein
MAFERHHVQLNREGNRAMKKLMAYAGLLLIVLASGNTMARDGSGGASNDSFGGFQENSENAFYGEEKNSNIRTRISTTTNIGKKKRPLRIVRLRTSTLMAVSGNHLD